jgi:undecaprenyl phosphate-alpha-L-ara4N flippase subunit ArnE
VTALAVFLCMLCQVFLLIGQLLFKHAMDQNRPQPKSHVAWKLFWGIVSQSLWFFLWLGLLQDWDLSKIFPFEGLNPVLLVLAAWLILKEKLTAEGWAGIVLISGGIVLVSMS